MKGIIIKVSSNAAVLNYSGWVRIGMIMMTTHHTGYLEAILVQVVDKEQPQNSSKATGTT